MRHRILTLVMTSMALLAACATTGSTDEVGPTGEVGPTSTTGSQPPSSAVPTTTSAVPITSSTVPTTTQPAAPQPNCRSAETGPLEGAGQPGDGVADPAGRIAYAIVGRYDEAFGPIGTQLYAVDPDGSDQVLLLDCDVIRPQWSPDGSRLAFTLGLDDGSWQIATIAADGSDLKVLTSGRGVQEIPSWSPDGSWLAFDGSDVALDDPGFWVTLRRVGADGSGAALLGNADTFDTEPRLSPDGREVVFVRYVPEADWASEVVIRDVASGDERVVVPSGLHVEHPEWAPDGGSLIFNGTHWAPNAATIYTLDLGAPDAAPVVLLDPATGSGGVKPVYSPDGSRIVFVCVSTDGSDDGICVMGADGADVKPLVDAPGINENHPTWGVATS